MKFIDILVREYKEWPAGVHCITQDSDGDINWHNNKSTPLLNDLGRTWKCDSSWMDYFRDFEISDDWRSAIITREQYEAALAASKTEWDGKFPIPAGTEVEVHFDGDDSRVWTPFRVEYMSGEVIVLHDYRIDSVDAYKQRTLSFRPIRSEADKKRSEICDKIYGALTTAEREGNRSDMAEAVYDAIAAGNVPGIRID